MAGASARLRAAVDEVWEAQHRHPFVTGIGDGSLPLERFQVYSSPEFAELARWCRQLTDRVGEGLPAD